MYTNSTLLSNACQQKKPLSYTFNSISWFKGKKLNISRFTMKELIPLMGQQELINRFKKMRLSHRVTLNHLIWMASEGMLVAPSQVHLGVISDVCRQQANRIIAEFKRMGLLDVYYRGRNKTAIYRLSSIFSNPEIWKALQDYLPILKSFMAGLISCNLLLSQPAIMLKECTGRRSATVLNIPLSLSLSQSVSSLRVGTARAYAREDFNKKGSSLNHFTPLLSGPVTDTLGLTLSGQAKLSIFNDEALDFALKRYKGAHKPSLKEPFRFFMSVCNEYYRNNHLTVNFAKFNRLADEFKLTEDMPLWDKGRIRTEKKVTESAERSSGFRKKTSFVCVHGCPGNCDGNVREHSQRGANKILGANHSTPIEEPLICVLGCSQPCKTANGWSAEHERRFKNGLSFWNYTVPSALKDEVLQMYTAQFGPKTEGGEAQLDMSQASTPTTGWKRPSEVVAQLTISQPLERFKPAIMNPFEDSGDNWYPEANEDLEEIW